LWPAGNVPQYVFEATRLGNTHTNLFVGIFYSYSCGRGARKGLAKAFHDRPPFL